MRISTLFRPVFLTLSAYAAIVTAYPSNYNYDLHARNELHVRDNVYSHDAQIPGGQIFRRAGNRRVQRPGLVPVKYGGNAMIIQDLGNKIRPGIPPQWGGSPQLDPKLALTRGKQPRPGIPSEFRNHNQALDESGDSSGDDSFIDLGPKNSPPSIDPSGLHDSSSGANNNNN